MGHGRSRSVIRLSGPLAVGEDLATITCWHLQCLREEDGGTYWPCISMLM